LRRRAVPSSRRPSTTAGPTKSPGGEPPWLFSTARNLGHRGLRGCNDPSSSACLRTDLRNCPPSCSRNLGNSHVSCPRLGTEKREPRILGRRNHDRPCGQRSLAVALA